ncbi:MAG: helix-turn-helix transcriptional regulator [Bdellovibrio sp.]|nr:helix-turn-helix transcriptional regulator [Bdellovibrio sp.]
MTIKPRMPALKMRQVIQREINNRGWSYRELAQKADIPLSTLHQWSSGSSPRDPVALLRLAGVFGLTLEELLFDQRIIVIPDDC